MKMNGGQIFKSMKNMEGNMGCDWLFSDGEQLFGSLSFRQEGIKV
jgi:hypothetical protein